MERRNESAGLIDGVMADLGGPRTMALLQKLEQAVPWDQVAKPIQRLYKHSAKGGRPAWPAVRMLKATMLSKWFSLSDPQLEECLQDRLSFRRFVGLSLTDRTPDETTFVVFRRRLREAGMDEKLFHEVLRHLEDRGLLVREGTLVDATIIDAPRGEKRTDETLTRDTENKERSRSLRERGVEALISIRRTSRREFTDQERSWNTHVARIRAFVEHPFAAIKHHMRYRRTRYRGVRRNRLDFCLTLVAHNLKRSISLRPT